MARESIGTPAENSLRRPDRADGFDVAIVGAGVVGCALARRFSLDGARVIVLEKALDILDGASKGNSAILHSGFDAPPDTLEADCIRRGRDAYLGVYASLGLPFMPCGALVLAWNEAEAERLPSLIDKARRNGVDDVVLLDRDAIRRQEPQLSDAVHAGIRVPGEALIDAWSAPYAYLNQAVANGARLDLGCEVKGGAFDGQRWQLETSSGFVSASIVINAAGLFGDRVDKRLLGTSAFTIKPRKGQFIVYDKPAAVLAGHILLPVPNEVTKGVVVCRTAYGNLLVGPTAEEQDDRLRAPLDSDTLLGLQRRGEEILPALKDHDITASYAGLRPASESSEYRITAQADQRYVTVGGIRSTGLSAALGIAEHVAALVSTFDRPVSTANDSAPGQQTTVTVTAAAAAVTSAAVETEIEAANANAAEPCHERAPEIHVPKVANISEWAERDWQRQGNAGIVCHCESVTRREIEQVLDGPLAPNTLAGLKRRTRVTMGRCQGFYCSAALAEMSRDRFATPMGETTVSTSSSSSSSSSSDQQCG